VNTKALNSLADLICRAQENGRRTPMGIAMAIEAAGRHMSPETARELDALRARVAELEALAAAASEFRLREPGYGLYVRRAPGGDGFAILEANRTSVGRRVWTTAGWRYSAVLVHAELFCWPDAESAVVEARRVMPGMLPDGITERVAPTQALQPAGDVSPQVTKLRSLLAGQREADGEHYPAVHHDYRTGRDLPEMGGQR
jgi:hypothetical protein